MNRWYELKDWLAFRMKDKDVQLFPENYLGLYQVRKKMDEIETRDYQESLTDAGY